MILKKCIFIGHRDAKNCEEKVYAQIKNLLAHYDIEFLSGGMGNFDKICERAVHDLGGKLYFIPYNVKRIKPADYLWYDEIICPFGNKTYSKFDIPNRNKWLVDNCDLCICYVYKDGGARKTLNYAEKKGKHIINII